MDTSTRYNLLSDYLDELWTIKGLPPQSQAEKLRFYSEVSGSPCTQWIDIRENDTLIGFLIIGTAPNCHPDADFYIEEAYIKPDFRHKGHMTAAFTAFVSSHKGTYCLFILNENRAAKRFWDKSFAALNYQPYALQDVGAGDNFCTQYGFKPSKDIDRN